MTSQQNSPSGPKITERGKHYLRQTENIEEKGSYIIFVLSIIPPVILFLEAGTMFCVLYAITFFPWVLGGR